jgi:radical SAM protein with 4Fe4S-binding SPASM domain
MKHNEHQAERMRQIARDLGVDRFVEKTVGINPADPNFQRLAEDLLPDDLSASRYERGPDGALTVKGEPVAGCEYIFSTLVVNSNGDAVPCCYDARSEFIMGNVFRQSLDEVWRGEKFRAFRRRVCAGRSALSICRLCPEGRVAVRMQETVSPLKAD